MCSEGRETSGERETLRRKNNGDLTGEAQRLGERLERDWRGIGEIQRQRVWGDTGERQRDRET